MCDHEVRCPSADGARQREAQVVAYHLEQGWYLLCNGVLLGDDIVETDTPFDGWRWLPPTGIPKPAKAESRISRSNQIDK